MPVVSLDAINYLWYPSWPNISAYGRKILYLRKSSFAFNRANLCNQDFGIARPIVGGSNIFRNPR